jgi:hypothetical protein
LIIISENILLVSGAGLTLIRPVDAVAYFRGVRLV